MVINMSDQVAKNYLHAFLERHPVKTYQKGEIIIFQGEVPRSAYVIKSGKVKAYNLSVGGEEKPVAFYSDTNIFPATWVYGKVANSIYYYEALTPTLEIYTVERNVLVDFIKKSPDLLYQEVENLLVDQLGGSMRLNALQHSRASDKLIYTLHYLALTSGKSLDKHKIELSIELTHQDFANLTGLTRETASTELNKLKKTGVIDYGKNSPYILDLSKLKQLLNDQFIADMQLITP
ncbi:MAG: Crp/Fnr family transcriptional regulator [Candidatus Saccharimonadales bacterium]